MADLIFVDSENGGASVFPTCHSQSEVEVITHAESGSQSEGGEGGGREGEVGCSESFRVMPMIKKRSDIFHCCSYASSVNPEEVCF